MKLIPVTALSSWTHCPRQFYLSYVLEVEEPPKDVMILGLIKHKLHEQMSAQEEKITVNLKQGENAAEIFRLSFTKTLSSIITSHSNALRSVNVSLVDAFQKSIPIVRYESEEKATRILPLIQQGLSGEELWSAIVPKVKTEYSLKSEKLGLKGRIDRLECYENTILPVELKSGKPPQEGVWEEHRIQAAAYALMLQDKFSTSVPEAIVQYVDHNIRRTVVLNPFLCDQVTETAEAIRKCLENETLPEGCGREKCSACKQSEQLFVQNQLQKPQNANRNL